MKTLTYRKKKIRNILLFILFLLFIAYWIACYFAVSLALVPSFMEKTDAFEEVTETATEALVQTSDIQNNHAAAIQKKQMSGYKLLLMKSLPLLPRMAIS